MNILRLEEKLRCNICDTNIDATNMTEEHCTASSHLFRKSNFEKILVIMRTSKLHDYRDSVISCWKKNTI